MNDLDRLRRQLADGLRGDDAHMSLVEAAADFPDWAINERAPNVAYTPWHLVEHVRITQWDILEYVRDPGHVSPPWPQGYWPDTSALATRAEFEASLAGFASDLTALSALIEDPATDLVGPMTHAPRHTVAREARVVANHNSYHTGEFAILRQVMGSWPAGRRD